MKVSLQDDTHLSSSTTPKYLFSVIMAVYNTEKYIREAMNSLLSQTIGFETIQVILVDDGSTDSSAIICDEYAATYPDNVISIHQDHKGVAAARNNGLQHASGRWVNFLCSDDKWSLDAFDLAKSFFIEHPGIKLCAFKINYFDAREGEHGLNRKFDKTRVVHLNKDANNPQTTVSTCFIERRAIQNMAFDEGLRYQSDHLFACDFLMNERRYGVVSEGCYYGRIRQVPTPREEVAKNHEEWWCTTLEHLDIALIEMSEKRFGVVIPFVQYSVLYDIHSRLRARPERTLDAGGQARYRELFVGIARKIDDDLLIGDHDFSLDYVLWLLSLKYGIPTDEFSSHITCKEDMLCLAFSGEDSAAIDLPRQINLRPLSALNRKLVVESIEIEPGLIRIMGFINTLFASIPDMPIAVFKARSVRGKRQMDVAVEHAPRNDKYTKTAFDGVILAKRGFVATVPWDGKEKIEVAAELHFNDFFRRVLFGFGKFVGLDREQEHSYWVRNGALFRLRKGKKGRTVITVEPARPFSIELEELKHRKEVNEYALEHGNDPLPGKTGSHLNYRLDKMARKATPQHRVAFVTMRGDNVLSDNLRLVKQELEGVPVKSFARMTPHDSETRLAMARALFESSVVVLDDYNYLVRDYGKRKGQKIVQLWHAPGAFKKFGQDGTSLPPFIDASYHREYDLVSVSSDYVRPFYANAFDIPLERIQALGVPRTDLFFSDAYEQSARARVMSIHPELEEKRLVLYAPTFRDGAAGRRYFQPKMDFAELSQTLPEDTVFCLRPHPVMTETIVPDGLENVVEIRDVSTQDLMFASDMLVTDYSSVIFEYSLLNKPMVFYCYDFASYNRDFYLDFENDLPGELLLTQSALTEYLNSPAGDINLDKLESFRSKYMSACDGSSSSRVASAIREML